MPRDRNGKMGEATLLHVRPPDPAGQLDGLSQMALRVVARAGPCFDDAEGQQRDGANVVLGTDLAYRRCRRRLEQRGNLAHGRAVVATPARKREPRGPQHRLEKRHPLRRHLGGVMLSQRDVGGRSVE